jgi:hypothetical protein
MPNLSKPSSGASLAERPVFWILGDQQEQLFHTLPLWTWQRVNVIEPEIQYVLGWSRGSPPEIYLTVYCYAGRWNIYGILRSDAASSGT